MTEVNNPNQSAWMPAAGGILSIIAGAFNIAGCALVLVFRSLLASYSMQGTYYHHFGLLNMPLVLGIIAMLFIVLDILAITGGINAIQRKNWGVAFAGSIAALFASRLLGIFSLIFIALSKKDFE
jgi:hypothetical protein